MGFWLYFLGTTPTATDGRIFREMFLNMSHALRTNMEDSDGANLISSLMNFALRVTEEMAHNPAQGVAAQALHNAQALLGPQPPFTATETVADYSKTTEIFEW